MNFLQRFFSIASFLLFLVVTSCSADEPSVSINDPEEEVSYTLLVYMPWSSNLTSFFYTNISDLEKAIEKVGLDKQRVIVFISTTSTKAEMFEITLVEGKCERNLLKEYSRPRFTTEEGLTSILLDVKDFAPADVYSIAIGCHGMGWLPVEKSRANQQRAKLHYEIENVPMTRYFGGTTYEYQTDISTLNNSIKQAEMSMEFILFDDCYMSSIEVAYELKDVTKYMIACPTEIMAFGMPYEFMGEYLLRSPDYEAICKEFYKFYTDYTYPWGTLGVTNCQELDELASIVKEITLANNIPVSQTNIQKMDGYDPTIFFDFRDYIYDICKDVTLLTKFEYQFEKTVPYSVHTGKFYSASRGGPMEIEDFCGITTSAPSLSSRASHWYKTAWAKAIN